jgi:hypothetical protein
MSRIEIERYFQYQNSGEFIGYVTIGGTKFEFVLTFDAPDGHNKEYHNFQLVLKKHGVVVELNAEEVDFFMSIIKDFALELHTHTIGAFVMGMSLREEGPMIEYGITSVTGVLNTTSCKLPEGLKNMLNQTKFGCRLV